MANSRTSFWPLVAYVALWCAILTGLQVYQEFLHRLYFFGVLPRHFEGLLGVITGPLVHQDWGHLFANLSSFAVGWGMLLLFYARIAHKVLALIWLSTGSLVWVFARESYHIGASGVVYGIVFFLIFSGIFRRNRASLAVAFVMLILNQGLIWGFTPQPGVSWESHLAGGFVGVFLGILFRKNPASDILSAAKRPPLPDDSNLATGVWDYEKRVRLTPPEEPLDRTGGREGTHP